MVMFVGAMRVEDQPEQWLPVHVDPALDRARVAAVLAERRAREHPGHQPWPAPEIPMYVVEPGALRNAPARLLSRLRVAGWRSVVTYARGTTFDAQKRPGRVVGSYAIRSSLGNRRSVAVWWEGDKGRLEEPRGVLVWGDRPAQWIGIREFEREV